MALQNARFDQLPLNGVVPSQGWWGFFNEDTGITERRSINDILFSAPSQNFEWVTDNGTGYSEDDFVTYNGFGWQSLVDNNLNNPPGVDPTKWVQINLGSNLSFWEAGAYLDVEVVIFKVVGTRLYIFRLDPDEPRPFISSNFDTELNSGLWQIGSEVQLLEVNTAGATITLNCLGLTDVMFKESAQITAPKTWAISNFINALYIKSFKFSLDGLHAQTMPANFKMESWRTEWDSATHVWTPSFAGSYEAELTYEPVANEWHLKIFGPFN